VLSFTASGETGTKGYVTVNIPKTLISDISTLKVYLDNKAVTFSNTQDSDAWIITINYSHSTHKIVMDLTGTQNQNNQPIPWIIVGAGVAFAIIAVLVVTLVLKKRQPKAKIDKF
jgi:N-methylhydantoinase B/oxoprolinase/acetone carboxylase alpha subunit